MPKQTVNGFSMHYEDLGAGPAVVLVHGFPLDGRAWMPVAEELSEAFRVVVPDLRGFGRSTDESSFTIESLADDVHALMSALAVSKYALAGLSMGGYVAQAFVKKYADALSALILCDTKVAGDNAQQKQGRDDMIALVRKDGSQAIADKMFPNMIASTTASDHPMVADTLRQIMESIAPWTIERALVALRDREDFVDLLPTIKVPVLIVAGEHDAISPPDVAKSMQARAPGSKLSIIPDAGHMAPFEQPVKVAEAIRGLLGHGR